MGKIHKLKEIKDAKAKSRFKRLKRSKKGKKLKGHIQVWDRATLETEKGITVLVKRPPRPGVALTGVEPKPGTIIKPAMTQSIADYTAGTLTAHIAGTPAVVCNLAQAAHASGATDYVDYVVDLDTGRSEYATARITGKHPNRGKGSLPGMLGGMQSGDHKGHGVPEAGVEDPDKVNVLPNLVPQDGTTNVSHKKIFENRVIKYADENPAVAVHTIHERHYTGDSLRPDAETHYVVADGVVIFAATIENP